MNYFASGVQIVEPTNTHLSIPVSLVLAVVIAVSLVLARDALLKNKFLIASPFLLIALGLVGYGAYDTYAANEAAHLAKNATINALDKEYGIDFSEYWSWKPSDEGNKESRVVIENVTTDDHKLYPRVMVTRKDDFLTVLVPENDASDKYVPLEAN